MRLLSVILVAVLSACGGSSSSSTSATTDLAPTPEAAREFLVEVNKELLRLAVAQSRAEWAKQTDITPEHEAAAAKIGQEAMEYQTRAIKRARAFEAIDSDLDADTRRQLLLLRITGTPAPDDADKTAELARLTTEMDSTYGKTKACDGNGNCRDLGALEEVMAKSRKPAELLDAWRAWHDNAGRAIKPMYERFVPLANDGAQGVGFANLGEKWRAGYDMSPKEFSADVDRLWSQVEPLYKQLHCYARRRLNQKYGDQVAPATGPIPAHLFGNMWSQSWGYIYPELEPYKGVAPLDVTPALVEQKYDAVRMVKLAEGFFTSLGLNSLPETFWERSMLTRPEGKEVVCHASAWDVEFNNDLRIKMCIRINHEDLVTIHHELGHDYYFNNYYTLPILYQGGANDGFHEAIGDTIALSMTPAYLKKMGLLSSEVKSDKAVVNKQMNIALDKLAFLPFGLVVDQWRWEVFAGDIAPAQYNTRWWELRQRFQGIVPPVERAATDFDPGAKYHVPANVPYTRYFLSTVLQFQFHRALCKKAGHTGPLHDCSIYGSRAAGDALKTMLAMGQSKPWPDALEAIAGERQMDAGALLEYFGPLSAWLEEQNKGQTCGW